MLEALLEANLQRNKDEWTISQELKLWNEVEVLNSKKKSQRESGRKKAAFCHRDGNQADMLPESPKKSGSPRN